ncbi:unnamed protein product [Lymnaea stagnalis]|uniref:HEAT repeat-containing protein 4 n=1 Tax=Lymnaea stagnalis TaxID=6523 RepID=A0AAV2ILJ9_LYMST
MASNLPIRASWGMLFPCATGVQMPHIGGAEDAKIKAFLGKNQMGNQLPMTIINQDKNPVCRKYVKMISSDISFTDDVIEDRCLHMMPYNQKYFENVFNPTKIIGKRKLGKRSKSSLDIPLAPRALKEKTNPQTLAPLQKNVKEKAIQLHQQALTFSPNYKKSKNTDNDTLKNAAQFFLTETTDEGVHKAPKLKPLEQPRSSKTKDNTREIHLQACADNIPVIRQKPTMSAETTEFKKDLVELDGKSTHNQEEANHDWDDYLLSGLSQLTANWIVHECMPPDKQKEKLTGLLESWYGPPTHTDLVREELSDSEESKEIEKPKKKWEKKEARLLSVIGSAEPLSNKALDPYSDENKAPFYRQPAGIRNKRRVEIKEEEGLINSTAQITIKERCESPQRTLKDFLSSRVGDKIYQTNDLFQQEWLMGNRQVYTIGGDPDVIKMETDHKYRKHLQQEFPKKPDIWYPPSSEAAQKGKSLSLPAVGHQRWTSLPELIDDSAGTMIKTSIDAESVQHKTTNSNELQSVKQNNALLTIAHDWRSQWFLSGQFADSNPDDLLRDMTDIQPHVRVKAISTLAKAAELRPIGDTDDPVQDKRQLDGTQLPEKLFVALEFLLDDSHEQVRKAAAITLYSLKRPSNKAKEMLWKMLRAEASIDRWAAAQCLAHYGEADSDVIAEIIKQILSCEDVIKYEQGIHLLSKLSNYCTLAHCMVAEQLNSSSWRHRVMACKILPTLFGSINRDISQKLSDLMWHDWHEEVRKAAAQCLGKAGHGRDVHDNIRHKILTGTERHKVEAINKLGQLGLMTSKLLPAFLDCFSEPYVSVRIEVCRTCGNLQIKEEQVLNRLVHLAAFDPIWQVKALAMQALGKIGEINDDIKECLLWALRYEDQAGVRAEACHSLKLLDVSDDDVILALQERLLVESNSMVRDEMKSALTKFGVSVSEDMDTVRQIKEEINKLCTRNVIASQILINETDETRREHLARMVCQTEKDIEILNDQRDNLLRNIRSQAQGSLPTSHATTPRPKLKLSRDGSGSSPEPTSRECTGFTPFADKELEALTGLDRMDSSVGSTSGKSRPVTEQSQFYETQESDLEQSTGLGESHLRYDRMSSDLVKEDMAGDLIQGQISRAPTGSKVRRQNRVRASPSHEPGKTVGVPQSGFTERRSIMSRATLKERIHVDEVMEAIYSDLEQRYNGMVDALVEADRGLNTRHSSEGDGVVDGSKGQLETEHNPSRAAVIEHGGDVNLGIEIGYGQVKAKTEGQIGGEAEGEVNDETGGHVIGEMRQVISETGGQVISEMGQVINENDQCNGEIESHVNEETEGQVIGDIDHLKGETEGYVISETECFLNSEKVGLHNGETEGLHNRETKCLHNGEKEVLHSDDKVGLLNGEAECL